MAPANRVCSMVDEEKKGWNDEFEVRVILMTAKQEG